MAFEAPVVRLVNLLIENAIAAQASDIHIEPFEDTLRIRYRLDGILFDQEAPPRRLQAAVTSRIKLMAEMNIAERRLPQDGRIRVTVPGRRVDIASPRSRPCMASRSSCGCSTARACSWRSRSSASPGHAPALRVAHQAPARYRARTGPTAPARRRRSTGRSTRFNLPDRKIITVEDPVEYQLKGVNQIPVKPKIGLTFATGLRHIVRQDPDVILIGEIRGLETAEIAIQRAHRPPGLLDAPHERRARRDHATARYGRGGYLVASVLEGRARPAARADGSARCRVPDTPAPPTSRPLG